MRPTPRLPSWRLPREIAKRETSSAPGDADHHDAADNVALTDKENRQNWHELDNCPGHHLAPRGAGQATKEIEAHPDHLVVVRIDVDQRLEERVPLRQKAEDRHRYEDRLAQGQHQGPPAAETRGPIDPRRLVGATWNGE